MSDKAIIAALVHPTPRPYNGRSCAPWLYVGCGPGGSGVDWNSWYVTGPDDRRGYVKGPFPREQVLRLVRSGEIEPEVVAPDGSVQAYALAANSTTCAACGGPRAKGSAAFCRSCYEKAENRYERQALRA